MDILSQLRGFFFHIPNFLKSELQFSSVCKWLTQIFSRFFLFAKFEIQDGIVNYLINYFVGWIAMNSDELKCGRKKRHFYASPNFWLEKLE